jgi:hypothetical protein
MFHLITTYYKSIEPEREAENLECLKENINNPLIEHIHLFLQGSNYPKILDIDKKVNYISFGKRPFFSDLFGFANNLENNKIKVVANSDIYFNESIEKASEALKKWDVLALTRWDRLENENLEFYNNYKSQDAWIFRKKLQNYIGEYHIGRHGCDNKLIYEMKKAGYKLNNPSLSIIAIHLHISNLRSYFLDPSYERVDGPYDYLLPTYLNNRDNLSKDKEIYFTKSRYNYYKSKYKNHLPKQDVFILIRLLSFLKSKFYAQKLKFIEKYK